MTAEGVLVVLLLGLSVGGGLLLYALVRDEANNRAAMDRERAERVARRDTDGHPASGEDDVTDRR